MKHTEMIQLYLSANGDTWFLVRDPATGTAFVRHKANIPSGGQVTDIPIDAFLSGPRNPEHEALLHLIGTLVPDTQGADTDTLGLSKKTGRKWSGAELTELEDLLMCEVSTREIARLMRRDHEDIRDKVAE